MKIICLLLSVIFVIHSSTSTHETIHFEATETAQYHESFSRKSAASRIIEIEFLIDKNRWQSYQRKYGNSTMHQVNQEINELVYETSKHLRKLNNGGFKLHLHKKVELLENSIFLVGPFYKDQRNHNITRTLNTTDMVGYTLAFQDAVSQQVSLGWSTPPNLVRFILAEEGVGSNAAAEESCICNPATAPCVGVITKSFGVPLSVLLAHEIGHTLGATPHDREPGYIMSSPIEARNNYVWSQMSRQKINNHNVECLQMEARDVGRTME